jgi:Arc/MetJ family transcription regulator
MRSTVDLDRELLERAKAALGTSTYREAIRRALEEAVSRAEMRVLVDELEGSDLTWGLEELLAYRRVENGRGR